jgi:hypothetical protein
VRPDELNWKDIKMFISEIRISHMYEALEIASENGVVDIIGLHTVKREDNVTNNDGDMYQENYIDRVDVYHVSGKMYDEQDFAVFYVDTISGTFFKMPD